MSVSPTIAVVLAEAGLWAALVPVGVVLMLFVSFEVAMAVTISTLPRSRMRQKWTPQEQRRVLRVFVCVFAVWPMLGGVACAHLFLPWFAAIVADAIAIALVVLSIVWLRRGIKERKLIKAGHCAECFYDLRESLHRDQCPECGVALHDHPARIQQ